MKLLATNSTLVFLAVIGLLVGGVLGIELTLLRRLDNTVTASAEQNVVLEQTNIRRRAEIFGLKADQSRVKALYVRLRDAIYNARATNVSRVSVATRLRSLDQDATPAFLKGLIEAGGVARPERVPPGENALIYEAGCSRLELQRLIPLLAEQENSNAFLFLDRVTLSRPESVPAFSAEPSYLNARFTIRILAVR
jgi:hypothetical protein